MYAREVKGRKLTFFVSGKLWGQSLVMTDQETGSEWSHLLGEAKAGSLNGEKLTIIPSSMTNWETWRAMHPNTTVAMLSRTSQAFRTERLQDGKRFGIGLQHHGKSRLWRLDFLEAQPLVNDQIDDLDLVVYFDIESRSPFVWNRRVAGTILTFSRVASDVRDRQTGSSWNLQTGHAIDGELAGRRLVALPAIMTYRSAWKRFHPQSTIWDPDDEDG